jgi:undecaprenyl diphosphate synthase
MNDTLQTPKSIGIIMDGNRRWATAQKLSSLDGHLAGKKKLEEVVRWAKEAHIRTITFYAFSTENWNRPEEEITYLMQLLEDALLNQFDEIKKEKVQIRFIGQRDRFSSKLQGLMSQIEKETSNNTEGIVSLALSYGGRAEILSAVNRVVNEGREVSEEDFSSALWTAGTPDPDLIIRTGGEKRLSNFLPWQSVYSELFFTNTLWPDFSQEEFTTIVKEFASRTRRMGR